MKKIFAIIVCSVCCCFVAAQPRYTLEQVLDSARRNNISMHTAQLGIAAAQQQRKEAFTKYFPNVSASGFWFNATRDMAKMTVNPSEYLTPEMAVDLATSLPPSVAMALASPMSFTMLKKGVLGTVTAVQPVFAGGRIINGNRLARVGEDVSRLQYRLSENEVEKTAEQYFWKLASLQEKLKTVVAAENLLNGIQKDVEVAVRAGVAMPNDLLQVQLRQNDVASQKLKLLNALSLLHMLVAQHCGLRDTAFVITYQAQEPSPLLAQQDPDQALLSPAEYQLLGKQVEAARLQRKLTVGENLPQVGVGVGYNYHNLFENDRSFGMVFASVSVPISDWWGGSHAIKRRNMEQQKAQEQLEDSSQKLKIRMQSAWNDVLESYEQLGIAERSIEQAEENLRLNRNYYQAGTSTMSDLLQAQLLYQQARDKRTDAFSDYHNKLLEYRQATGQ